MSITSTGWPPGLLTPLVTPFRDDEVDVATAAAVVERQVADGAAGVVVGGGTGEFGALSVAERRILAEAVVDVVAGRLAVVVQVGALATRDSLALAEHATDVGADALLAASPFGEPITWRERKAFYDDLDAAGGLPMMVYNTPPAGILTLDQVQELAALPSVSAVKDSSGDAYLLGDLLAWARDRTGMAVYVGADSLLVDAAAHGATGALLGVGNFLAREVTEVMALVAARDTDRAAPRWAALRRLLRFMEQAENYVALVKDGCAARGVEVGPVRRPYLTPSDEERRVFRKLLADVDAAFEPA